jgi:hypothetical protein
MSEPQRIQRKRTTGFSLKDTNKAVGNGLPYKCVHRPFKYGNPFRLGDMVDGVVTARENFKPYYRKWLLGTYSIEEIQGDLKGKNLVCFCSLEQPCHVDILLELANRS